MNIDLQNPLHLLKHKSVLKHISRPAKSFQKHTFILLKNPQARPIKLAIFALDQGAYSTNFGDHMIQRTPNHLPRSMMQHSNTFINSIITCISRNPSPNIKILQKKVQRTYMTATKAIPYHVFHALVHISDPTVIYMDSFMF
jgi:hypothetical protein